jgi:hypothetical protein
MKPLRQLEQEASVARDIFRQALIPSFLADASVEK